MLSLNFFIDPDVLLKDMSALLEVLEGRLLQHQLLPAGGTRQDRLESASDYEKTHNYKHDDTINRHSHLASFGTNRPLHTWQAWFSLEQKQVI